MVQRKAAMPYLLSFPKVCKAGNKQEVIVHFIKRSIPMELNKFCISSFWKFVAENGNCICTVVLSLERKGDGI
jgi:hypothetical protein